MSTDVVNTAFRAEAESVLNTFRSEAGVAGFRIPIYQRAYSWGPDHIERLLADIVNGVSQLGHDGGYISFVGSMLLVVDNKHEKEKSFSGQSLSIIDGQQRLTTLSLMAALLWERIGQLVHNTAVEPSSDARDWLIDEAANVRNDLFACCIGYPSGPATSSNSWFPRIVRQESDTRADVRMKAEYLSPVAHLLNEFGKYVDSGSVAGFECAVPGWKTAEFLLLQERVGLIKQHLSSIESATDEIATDFPSVKDLVSVVELRKHLFNKLPDHQIKTVINEMKAPSKTLANLARLVSFARFALERTAFTKIETQKNEYAFDIFDSLNTTGQSLTAFETFKPQVIHWAQHDAGHLDPAKYGATSEVRREMEGMEAYLNGFSGPDAQQRETKEVVTAFALHAQGRKLTGKLADQRRYLQRTFRELKPHSSKRLFVSSLCQIAEYRSRFWDKKQLPSQLMLGGHGNARSRALATLAFILDMKTSLSVPILARYWAAWKDDPARYCDLFDAINAVGAFIAIRRGATGTTDGIDANFRAIMAGESPCVPLALFKNNLLPDVGALRIILCHYLRQRGIVDRASFVAKASTQPLYTRSQPLCRYLLLSASHDAVPMPSSPHLLEKGKKGCGTCLDISGWQSDSWETVEHVAPDVTKSPADWPPDVYSDEVTKQMLGNLTLLPRGENTSISNRPWTEKVVFYQAFAAATPAEVAQCLKNAASNGIEIGKKTQQLLRNGTQLRLMTGIAKVEEWNKKVIDDRTANLAGLAWDELAPCLGL